jgi:hypothetical protein
MTQLGADPDHLRDLARSLRSAAGQLDTLSFGLARRARAAGWRGPDAEAFERRWQVEHRPRLHHVSEQLVDLSRRAERHADEQLRASGGAAMATHAFLPASPAVTTPKGPASPDQPSPARPMPALPRSEDRYSGGIDLRIGPVVGSLSGDLTLQRLGDDRVRVVFAQAAGLGAALSAGASAELAVGGPGGAGAPTSGAAADGRVRLAGVERRVWEVDEARVDDLLARLAVEQGASAAVRHSDPVGALAGALDAVAERVTGRDPGLDLAAALTTALPAPTRSDRLAEIEVSGAMGVGMGAIAGLGARAGGVSALRAGTSSSAAGRASVVEYQGSSTGALTSTLLRRLGVQLPADVHRALNVRLEWAPGAAPGDQQLLVRASAITDERIDDVVARVTLGGAGDAAATSQLASTVAALGRGDVTRAIAELEQLRIPVEHVEVVSDRGELSGRSARGGMGAGAGLGAGITARGAVVHVDRRG